jgi:hypothetical protein
MSEIHAEDAQMSGVAVQNLALFVHPNITKCYDLLGSAIMFIITNYLYVPFISATFINHT